jgi:CheY-like chemotaxis protein
MRKQIRVTLESDPDIEICAEASDGVEALQKVEESVPDLALTDFHMPAMNGLEATRQIKKRMPTLPIFLFTLECSRQLEDEGRRAGGHYYPVEGRRWPWTVASHTLVPRPTSRWGYPSLPLIFTCNRLSCAKPFFRVGQNDIVVGFRRTRIRRTMQRENCGF